LKTLLLFILLLIPVLLTAQDFNYVHYDTKDGLAGSTVYSMCQDKDGFIWFGTENGLSRFDGTNFKNFTVKDGLPDNEVLKVFADSKGRVWIGTFSKEICFIYNGRIHNSKNDDFLKKIVLNASLNCIQEDANHFLAITTNAVLIMVTPSDSVIKHNLKDIFPTGCASDVILGLKKGAFFLASKNFGDLIFDAKAFRWNYFPDPNVGYYGMKMTKDSFVFVFPYTKANGSIQLKNIYVPGTFITILDTHSLIEYVNTTDGSWSFDTVNLKKINHYLPGNKISCALEDKEKCLWFGSLGNGVFKLLSHDIKSFSFFNDTKNSNTEVFSIIGANQQVIAGMDGSKAEIVGSNFKVKEINYRFKESEAGTFTSSNRLYSMINISGSVIVLGFDKFLVKLENGRPTFDLTFPIKSVEKINNDFIIVGTSAFAFKMRLKDMQITDTIWRERCTKVFYSNDSYYIGTLSGLYQVRQDKTHTWLGNLHKALTRRITDIKSSADGTLWISTSDNGIVGFKNGKIIKAITDSNGLSSNICKTLFVKENELWVGTDKGINKISINGSNNDIVKYSTSDGLPSNVINAIYVKDSMVWVGSPAGLTYFNEKSISSYSICNLKMLQIKVSGREVTMDSVFNLSYKDNNINFEYAAISFRSGGEITYHYKLTGLDNDWKTTSANELDYKSLQGGNYTLHLYAVNKYGIKSQTLRFDFSIAIPFWKAGWFYAVLFVLVLALVVLFFNRRNQITKRRLEEKNRFQKQFAALEQQALQSQMNPHFIFNCLNSIQQYILTNDKQKANEYLTGFAALIRQTLDISAQQKITVAEEASYLTKYIEMERMRFGDSFIYTIDIDHAIKADYIQMPALLLQPYVENSIRHGLRYKKDGTAKIEISFSIKQGNLCCIIKDNGIGRQKSAEFKSSQHIEYQSKGMHLTSKRIQLLNTMEDNNISVMVLDLKNDDDTPAGTLVQINITI
jgi:two-component sensor histidine kinase